MARIQAEKQTVPLVSIGLDPLNPRLEPQEGQRQAIRAMIEKQRDKIVNLAEDIKDSGLSDAERFMVMVPADKKHPFISLDGNRRLVALKLLYEPNLADGILSQKAIDKLKKISDEFAENPIKDVEVAIYTSREHAAPWVSKRHSVGLEGRGQDSWDSLEKQRFDAWQGKTTPEYQVLEFVRTHGNLTQEQAQNLKSVPISTLRRLIGDKYVKSKLGISIKGNEVTSTLPDEEVVKPLKKIVFDLVNKVVNVTKLERTGDRAKYIDGFEFKDLPKSDASIMLTRKLGDKEQLATPTTNTGTEAKTEKKHKTSRRPSTNERTALIPKECHLEITPQRIHDIYVELTELDSNAYSNAVAVLMRVFLELSLDDYIASNNIVEVKKRDQLSLDDKLHRAAGYMVDNGILTKSEAIRVFDAARKDAFLAASIRLMHKYIHNQAVIPLGTDIRKAWSNLQPFLEKIWSERP